MALEQAAAYAVEAVPTAKIVVEKGHYLRPPGGECARVYTLHTGWAVRFRGARNGRRQILSFYLPGDFVGLESLGVVTGDCSIRALTDLTLCEFDSASVLSLLVKKGQSATGIVAAIAQSRAHMDEILFALGRCSAMERLVQLILSFRARMLAAGAEETDEFSMPLKRDDLADALGLTPVHVSRILAKLKHDGLLSFESGTVTIFDVDWAHAVINDNDR